MLSARCSCPTTTPWMEASRQPTSSSKGGCAMALLAAAASRRCVTLLGGEPAMGFQADEHAVSVAVGRGPSSRNLRAALLVAADGRASPLREAAGIGVVRWSYPQTGIVTTVRLEQPHQGRAVQHFLPSGPFAILPLTDNRACITWTEDAAEAREILALDDAGFLAEVEKRFGYRLGGVALAGPRASWPLDMHLARALVADRFALRRRRRARRAPDRRPGPEPGPAGRRRAGRGRRRRGPARPRHRLADGARALRALAAARLGALSRHLRCASTGCSPTIRRCCARPATSAWAWSSACRPQAILRRRSRRPHRRRPAPAARRAGVSEPEPRQRVGWVKRSADPTQVAISAGVGSSLTLDPTYEHRPPRRWAGAPPPPASPPRPPPAREHR